MTAAPTLTLSTSQPHKMNIIVTQTTERGIALPSPTICQVCRFAEAGAALQITYSTSRQTLNNLSKYEGKEGSRRDACEREVHSKRG